MGESRDPGGPGGPTAGGDSGTAGAAVRRAAHVPLTRAGRRGAIAGRGASVSPPLGRDTACLHCRGRRGSCAAMCRDARRRRPRRRLIVPFWWHRSFSARPSANKGALFSSGCGVAMEMLCAVEGPLAALKSKERVNRQTTVVWFTVRFIFEVLGLFQCAACDYIQNNGKLV